MKTPYEILQSVFAPEPVPEKFSATRWYDDIPDDPIKIHACITYVLSEEERTSPLDNFIKFFIHFEKKDLAIEEANLDALLKATFREAIEKIQQFAAKRKPATAGAQ